MREENVILREFKYFDKQMVIDFLSSIEGGLAKESRSSSFRKSGKIGGEAGLPGLSLKGETGTVETSDEETKTIGDAALFQRLYDALDERKMINKPHLSEKDAFQKMKQGSIIEIEGRIELPFFEVALDAYGKLLPIIQQNSPPGTDQKGLAVFELLSSSETLNVRILPSLETGTNLVAVLQRRKLRVSKQELEDEYSSLCRVKNVLKKGETFDVFKLPVKLNIKLIKELIKNFSSMPQDALDLLGKKPTEEDLQVQYPAFILSPIAIYQ